MEQVPCNLCGSTRLTPVYEMPDRRYFLEEFFTVVECADCGLGFVNPRPSFEEMQKYYPPDYYEEFSRNREYHEGRYAREATYLREIEASTGPWKLLDVGCANGDFPRFMRRRGWTVEAVEVSPSAKPIQDFPVYPQRFPQIPVHQPTCDAITAWAVIEHVHDPMAYFRKAAEVLKPGGLFVFLVTNFESLASRYLFLEDIPRHLYFFTRKTAREYLETTGFKLERADCRGNIHVMPAMNWLPYSIQTRIKRKEFTYRDMPLSRIEYLERHRLKPGVLSTLRFALEHPVTALDRALLPLVSAIQILRKNYGICTYVARKL